MHPIKHCTLNKLRNSFKVLDAIISIIPLVRLILALGKLLLPLVLGKSKIDNYDGGLNYCNYDQLWIEADHVVGTYLHDGAERVLTSDQSDLIPSYDFGIR